MTAPKPWLVRAALKRSIRGFFERRDYLELDTPIGVVCPGTEVHLSYFKTSWRDHAGKPHDLYLRSSPELHLKQALAEGAPKLFQLAPCFRNAGELSPWHHPEFTMLEWYETNVTFDSFITGTESLLRETHAELTPLIKRELGRSPVQLPKTFRRITVAEAFREFAHIDLIDQDPDLAAKGESAGAVSLNATDDFETAFFKLLIERIEPGLVSLGGAVLLDYPASQAALAVVESGVAKRFEFYLDRVELCNGFKELLDPTANRQRLRDSLSRRKLLGADLPPEDPQFYAALSRGLPPCCGNALGFDRWLALLMGDGSLDQAIPFRHALPYRTP